MRDTTYLSALAADSFCASFFGGRVLAAASIAATFSCVRSE